MDSAILEAFFEECEDLLTALVDGLADMRAGNSDTETVNAVFRAVHSIKGAAGAFAMEALVNFAHTFETVLDQVRSGTLLPVEDVLKVLQRAGDILSELVEAERDNSSVDNGRVSQSLSELEGYLENQDTEEEFSFDALTIDFDSPTSTNTFQVNFKPGRAFYASGHDPLNLIQAVAAIADITTRCNTGDLPSDLAAFDLHSGYLAWALTVTGQCSDLEIRQVFEFVDDLCELNIEQITTQAEAVDVLVDLAPPSSEPLSDPTPQTASEAAKPAVAAERGQKKTASSLRVDPERVDRLINAVGELIINQSVISQRVQEASLPSSSELHSDLDDYKLLAREIQEGVMAIRAQPVKPLFQRILRIGREAADATGKKVEIVTDGEATEVDKTVVERLADPLTHMIRNAIDHGIEPPEQREQAGKPETGSLKLSASQKSGTIVIEISDDGAGLDRQRIRQTAINRNLISADMQLSEQQIDQLLFAPGFSTAQEVTNLSGRGVGMDVVKTAITELGGRVSISTVRGEGTTFTISLPLTLAVMDGMVVNVQGQTFVVPITSIAETVRPSSDDLATIGLNGRLLRIRGEYIPIVNLGRLLGNEQEQTDLTGKVLLVVQNETVPQCALAVDDIFDQRQVVVKSMQGHFGDITGVSGATILGDGKIALIIDIDAMASTGIRASMDTQNHKEELERA